MTSPDTSGRVRLIQETMRSTGKVDADETIRNIFFRKEGIPDVLVCTEAVDKMCIRDRLQAVYGGSRYQYKGL